MTAVLNPRDLSFLLYELLDVDALSARPRFADQGREVFDAVIDTARAIADEHFSPSMKRNDQEEPQVVDGKVVTQSDLKATLAAVAEAGFIAGTQDAERGGMQLPHVIASLAIAHFEAANVGSSSYPMLTAGSAHLISSFGTEEQKALWLPPMFEGRFTGTMALTEPDAGSSLSDLRTTATPADDGTYRMEGTKIWISGGDHELCENIVHLVLARIAGAPPGTKGISLFIVPKKLVAADGKVGAGNNVTLAGLIHKMGWRGTTSALLNFGEQGPCVGYLVGEPHKGLPYMFQMMNDARIAVGRAAAAMGYAAYLYSLDYARTRHQGRLPSEKDPLKPPVAIIEHADVRRMLLQQKCAVEGSMALVLECARLVDDEQTAPDEAARTSASLLLEVLTPIAKAWPSATCQDAISNAMQVLGGYGYAREYNVEQLYRDNRLNQIHEGTNGIQALDLLGRKVTQQKGAAYAALVARMDLAIAEAAGGPLDALAGELRKAVQRMTAVTKSLVGAMQADPTRGLANATVYLELVSRTVYAWIWLRQAMIAERALAAAAHGADEAFYKGKVQAARFYFGFELPKGEADAALLMRNDASALEMHDEWF
jgi:butyryl-CoA dehydrogenase